MIHPACLLGNLGIAVRFSAFRSFPSVSNQYLQRRKMALTCFIPQTSDFLFRQASNLKLNTVNYKAIGSNLEF